MAVAVTVWDTVEGSHLFITATTLGPSCTSPVQMIWIKQPPVPKNVGHIWQPLETSVTVLGLVPRLSPQDRATLYTALDYI